MLLYTFLVALDMEINLKDLLRVATASTGTKERQEAYCVVKLLSSLFAIYNLRCLHSFLARCQALKSIHKLDSPNAACI